MLIRAIPRSGCFLRRRCATVSLIVTSSVGRTDPKADALPGLSHPAAQALRANEGSPCRHRPLRRRRSSSGPRIARRRRSACISCRRGRTSRPWLRRRRRPRTPRRRLCKNSVLKPSVILIHSVSSGREIEAMMGPRQVIRRRCSTSSHLSDVFRPLACRGRSAGSSICQTSAATWRRFYSPTGRPSIDPDLLVRMLLVGYCYGIRSERRLCEEVHLNLAYRWFYRLGLDGEVPDHSMFSLGGYQRGRPHPAAFRCAEGSKRTSGLRHGQHHGHPHVGPHRRHPRRRARPAGRHCRYTLILMA